MKTISYTLFFLTCLFGTATAQNTFSFTPDTVFTYAAPQDSDVEQHIVLQNLQPLLKTIRWERTEIALTEGCKTQVCDANLCYVAHVSTKTFPLQPNESVNMIVHLVNLTGNPCCALIRLNLFDVSNPADSLAGIYLFNDCALLGSDEPLPAAQVRVFPNPVSTHFMLEHAEDVFALRIYSLDGRELLRLPASPDQVYNLDGQPAGTYVVVLEDKQGRNFQAIEIYKN